MANQQARDDAIVALDGEDFGFGNHLFASKQPAIGFVNDDAVGSDVGPATGEAFPLADREAGHGLVGRRRRGGLRQRSRGDLRQRRWGGLGERRRGGLRRHRRLLVKGCHHLFELPLSIGPAHREEFDEGSFVRILGDHIRVLPGDSLSVR